MTKRTRPERRIGRIGIGLMILGVFFQLAAMDAMAQSKMSTSSALTTRITTASALSLRAAFTYSPTYPVEGQTVRFTEASTGSPSSWQWNFGDGTTSTVRNPTHAYRSSGFRKVTLKVTSSAGSKLTTRTLTVVPATATATFTFSPSTPGPGQSVQFTDTTTGSPTSWQWSFGDGGTSLLQNPSHSFASEGSYTITLLASNSSGSKRGTNTITVTSMSVLSSSFTYSPSLPVIGQAVQFTDTSSGSPTSWQWSFGDNSTSTSRNPSHTYTTAGSKTVTLTVSNGTSSIKATRTVTVASGLAASFSYSPASPVINAAIQFTDTSTGSPTSWQWDFGDSWPSTSQNPSHKYMTAGSHTVTLTVTNSSGSSTVTRTVTVASGLTASFGYSPALPTVGQAVTFTDASAGSPTAWLWDFNDGATSTTQSPSHTFLAAGTYSVTLTATNSSGSSTAAKTIVVAAAETLAASFTFSPSSPEIGGTVNFTDTSTGIPTSWKWDFGDGSSGSVQNPSHAYATEGSYSVTLTVTNTTGSSSLSHTVTVVSASAIIPAERKIDWSRAGVWENGIKGIPNRTTIFCNVKSGIPGSSLVAVGNGSQDDTAALKAAISLCPSGQVVYIPEGTYKISSTLSLGSGVTIRGAGPDKTKIIQYASDDVVDMTGSSVSYNSVSATSGFSRGSDTVVVSSASNYKVGDIVLIDQLNDPSLVTSSGVGGTCTWCGLYGTSGTRSMGESLLIKSISGNVVTFNRPLYYEYSATYSPQLSRIAANPIRNAGVEDMHLQLVAGASSGSCVYMSRAVNCWVKGVETSQPENKHVYMYYYCVGNEVSGCYFHDSQSFASNHGGGVELYGFSCDNLIQDNIFDHLHVAVALEAGGAGNVIAYNYTYEMEHFTTDWMIWHFGTHGAHTYMNLWEGNVAGQISFDNYWGSGSHQMVFRNHLTRYTPNQPIRNNIIAAIVEVDNYYDTFVGNILGTLGCGGEVEQIPFKSGYDNPVLWKIGYSCCSGTGYAKDTKVAATLIRSGNWEYPNNAIQWSSSEHTLPDSLYLSSKPDWFGVLAWPPFIPDRSDFDPSNLNKIPAQVRFENGPLLGLAYSLSRGS
jgi:PKD repeat protein